MRALTCRRCRFISRPGAVFCANCGLRFNPASAEGGGRSGPHSSCSRVPVIAFVLLFWGLWVVVSGLHRWWAGGPSICPVGREYEIRGQRVWRGEEAPLRRAEQRRPHRRAKPTSPPCDWSL